jgi:pimeloyl-ACP methyl ester carboxylesterase
MKRQVKPSKRNTGSINKEETTQTLSKYHNITMIKKLSILLLFLITSKSFAQNRVFSNQFYFLSELVIEKNVGKKFRYTVDLKSVPNDSISNIYLKTLQIGKDRYDFVQSNGYKKKHLDTLWHTATVESTINVKGKKIWLYVIQEGNGNFYADNMKLEIQETDGSWSGLPIENGSFELNDKNPLKDFIKNKELPTGTTVSLTSANAKNGKSLLIKANGGTSSFVTYYGNNNKTGNFCTINGTNIYYETYGSGEPLLLLHGNGQSIAAFSKQIPAFSAKYKVIAVDTRAQGKSVDNTTEKFTYDLFADDMKTLLDSLHLKNVNVLGWSDGGNTALIMAIKYPTYVNKVMVMGANLNPSTAAVDENILKQTNRDIVKLEKDKSVDTKTMVKLLKMVLTEPNINVDDLGKINSKVLVMAGEKDLIKEEHTKLIASQIKGVKLLIFKGETHFIPKENPTKFNEAILEFLLE